MKFWPRQYVRVCFVFDVLMKFVCELLGKPQTNGSMSKSSIFVFVSYLTHFSQCWGTRKVVLVAQQSSLFHHIIVFLILYHSSLISSILYWSFINYSCVTMADDQSVELCNGNMVKLCCFLQSSHLLLTVLFNNWESWCPICNSELCCLWLQSDIFH